MGKLFDDRGNPMTPTHAKKKGVRYRYYVSHALLQGRKGDAGSIARVSAPDLEKVIVDALRSGASGDAPTLDRDVVDRYLHRAVVGADSIAIELLAGEEDSGSETDPLQIRIPFSTTAPCRKGVAHEPSAAPDRIDEASRAALLTAIARSRGWIDAILKDPAQSFKTIADREHLAERHIRFLTPLAFLSPKIIQAIVDGQAPADLTVSGLARGLPMAWREQEAAVGLA